MVNLTIDKLNIFSSETVGLILWNFTESILSAPSLKFLQIFSSMQNSGCHGMERKNFKNLLSRIYWRAFNEIVRWCNLSDSLSGPSCSKLTTLFVNDSLKFTLSDTQIWWNFLLKKMCKKNFAVQKLLTFFQQKNIRILYIESAKTVNEMTLIKLMTLWTIGPRSLRLMLIDRKTWPKVGGTFLLYMAMVQTSKIFLSESIQGISIKLYRDVLWVTIRFFQLMLISQVLMPVDGTLLHDIQL